MFKIEKNIPMPPSRGFLEGGGALPFSQMEIGDSFFVPLDFKKDVSAYLATNIQKRKRAYGEFFKRRKVDGGIRVWRVAPPVSAVAEAKPAPAPVAENRTMAHMEKMRAARLKKQAERIAMGGVVEEKRRRRANKKRSSAMKSWWAQRKAGVMNGHASGPA